jgi:hypothetical protein
LLRINSVPIFPPYIARENLQNRHDKEEECSETWSHADWYMDTDVSENLAVSIFRVVQGSGIRYSYIPED